MKLKKIAAVCASSAIAVSSAVPVYAAETGYGNVVSDSEIEEEQKKDEEFDEEYGTEDSDNDPFIDDQDQEKDDKTESDGKKHCCKCGCCIEEEEPEEEDDGYICGECKIELTREEMEKNAKELATMLDDYQALKNDTRFSSTFPLVREDMESGDIMMLSDAMYIYVILENEIYTWYEVTDDGLKETPNLRFSNYASFYRVNKADAAFTIPAGLMAYQGDTLSDISLPSGFTWQKPDKELNEIGNTEALATYMPDNLLLYRPVYNIKVNVQVKKQPMDLTYPESRYTVAYTKGLTLGSILLPPGWSFEKDDTVLDVGSKIYTAVFEKDDKYDYTAPTDPVQIRVDVDKSAYFIDDIHITVPAGTVLNDNVLPKVNNGRLEWDVAQRIATIPIVYTCHFVPDDLARYRITRNIPVHITVNSLSAEEVKPQNPVMPPVSAVTEPPAVTSDPTDIPDNQNGSPSATAIPETQSPSPSAIPSVSPSALPSATILPETTQAPVASESPATTEIPVTKSPEGTAVPAVTSVPSEAVTSAPSASANGNKFQNINLGGTLDISSIKGKPSQKPGATPVTTKTPVSTSKPSVNTVQTNTPKPVVSKNPATAKPSAKPATNTDTLSVKAIKKTQNKQAALVVTSKNTVAKSFTVNKAASKKKFTVNKSFNKPVSVTPSYNAGTSYPATITVSSSGSGMAPKSFTVKKSNQYAAKKPDTVTVQSSTYSSSFGNSSFNSRNSEVISADTPREISESAGLSSFTLGTDDDTTVKSSRDNLSVVEQDMDVERSNDTPSSITLLADGEVPKAAPKGNTDMAEDTAVVTSNSDEQEKDEQQESKQEEVNDKETHTGLMAALSACVISVVAAVVLYFVKHRK